MYCMCMSLSYRVKQFYSHSQFTLICHCLEPLVILSFHLYKISLSFLTYRNYYLIGVCFELQNCEWGHFIMRTHVIKLKSWTYLRVGGFKTKTCHERAMGIFCNNTITFRSGGSTEAAVLTQLKGWVENHAKWRFGWKKKNSRKGLNFCMWSSM